MTARPNPKDPQAELKAAIGWTDIKKREQAVKELLQAREQQLLTELLGELPEKKDMRPEIKVWLRSKEYSVGFNEALDEVVKTIEKYREGL